MSLSVSRQLVALLPVLPIDPKESRPVVRPDSPRPVLQQCDASAPLLKWETAKRTVTLATYGTAKDIAPALMSPAVTSGVRSVPGTNGSNIGAEVAVDATFNVGKETAVKAGVSLSGDQGSSVGRVHAGITQRKLFGPGTIASFDDGADTNNRLGAKSSSLDAALTGEATQHVSDTISVSGKAKVTVVLPSNAAGTVDASITARAEHAAPRSAFRPFGKRFAESECSFGQQGNVRRPGAGHQGLLRREWRDCGGNRYLDPADRPRRTPGWELGAGVRIPKKRCMPAMSSRLIHPESTVS